ncbi:acylphosphatase [Candidatus Bathyarchaeota archaeon]|nr:acylphosphatase [Candidatus Bathyarchaeota archaeon]
MKKKLIIKGEKVQDVGYRLFLLDVAEELGLTGFQARNIKDYVEFIVEGDDEKVSSFLSFAKENYPSFAKVSEIYEKDYEGEVISIDRFYHRFSIDQLVKMVEIGVNMLGKQDEMLNKQDQMLKKQDEMITKQDQMLIKQDQSLNKQDQMLKKQDEMIGKQDEMIGKQDEMIGKQDEMLGGQYSLLKKQDEIIIEIRALRGDLRSFMEERLDRIERDIAIIKAKIGLMETSI